MIGLMFFGAIALWALVAFYLGRKLPTWFRLKPQWAWLFALLVFFAPVMDEVIAIPQTYALCKQAEEAFWYDPSAKGGVLKYYDDYSSEERTIGLNIKVKIRYGASVLKDSHAPVIKNMDVYFSSGLLHMPAGSSGTSMPFLLPETCPSRLWSMTKYQATLKLLELTTEPRPDFQ